MAEILKMWPESDDKKVIYQMTKAKSTSVKDLNDSDTITPVRFCLYKDVNNKDGVEKEILTILDEGGTVVGTISPTFKRDFLEIADLMGEDKYEIMIVKGTSKAGREFVSCELVC